MEKRELNLRLNTPGFIGNATQQAQWRTPPLKALLRFWWRIAVAADTGRESIDEMRARELELFGAAGAGDNRSHRSRVLLRLANWESNKNRHWSPEGRALKTVKIKAKKPYKGNYSSLSVRADAYLGFGPLRNDKQKGVILDPDSERTAMLAGAEVQLTLGITMIEEVPAIDQAINLVAQFGTLGGRSNNAWGSLSVNRCDKSPIPLPRNCMVNLNDCLNLQWPAGLGCDGKGPLVWETDFHDTWEGALSELALLRRAMRESCEISSSRLSTRHLTGYPVTDNKVAAWEDQSLRLPDQIRFKVLNTAKGQYWGRVYHLPHGVPDDMPEQARAQALLPESWRKCHECLDKELDRAEVYS